MHVIDAHALSDGNGSICESAHDRKERSVAGWHSVCSMADMDLNDNARHRIKQQTKAA